MTTAITIETLEKLATEIQHDQQTQRDRLVRLCVAYARIVGLAAPDHFARSPLHHGDESGHWDGSYPPSQEYSDYTGPRLIVVAKHEVEDVATSPGFYHNWRRRTTYGGLAIDARGYWYRCDESGTGRLGSYAAHPGDCEVSCTLEWGQVDREELDVAELQQAESHLRALAFPLAAARLK
jgi:hypothetical protein